MKTRSVRRRDDTDAAITKLRSSPLCSTELMGYVLSNFLDIPDIGVLDSAMTNKTLRPDWLKSLHAASGELTFEKHRHDERSFRWILSRQIRISTLSFDKKCKNSSIAFPPDYSLPSLTAIHPLNLEGSTTCQLQQIAVLARGSPNLTSVDLYGYYGLSDSSFALLASSCPKLHTLKVHFYCIKGSGLAAFALHCKQLKSLTLSEEAMTSSDEDRDVDGDLKEAFQALHRHCSELQSIDLCGLGGDGSASLIHSLVGEHSPLQSIVFPNMKVLDEALIHISNACPLLKQLHMGYNNAYTSRSVGNRGEVSATRIAEYQVL
jgi:hypothetical protein